MPKDIELSTVILCAKQLDNRGHYFSLGNGITVNKSSGKIRIYENGYQVFSIKATIAGSSLSVDYPKTVAGEEGRGWGILGMLLALRHASHQNCSTVIAETQFELGSYAYWEKFGITHSRQRNIQKAIIGAMSWVKGNIIQPSVDGTSLMMIRDKLTGSVIKPKRRLSNNF
ncbi:hypothetical protein [Sinobacterium caligoides]|nr:hypothetical protein [Sinobacterium caligoides]